MSDKHDSDDDTGPAWPPLLFSKQMQDATEELMSQQTDLYKQMLSAGSKSAGSFSQLGTMSMGTAMFKTRVQSGGRISIPDAERDALGIDEGDIVQAIIIPVKKSD